MRITRIVFALSGVYGILVLAPMLFGEAALNSGSASRIIHPEFYYGFVCLALVFQALFILIAFDPIRYRPIMLVGAAEKLAFFVPVIVLEQGRRLESNSPYYLGGLIDGFLALIFVAAWIASGKQINARSSGW